MNVTFKALDTVNYDTLESNTTDEWRLIQSVNAECEGKGPAGSERKHCPDTLLEMAARQIVSTDRMPVLSETVTQLPQVPFVNQLLRAAIKHDKTVAAILLISEWPVEDLCLLDVYPEGKQHLFGPKHKLDDTILMALMRRTHARDKCKLTTMDLRGFDLNSEFQMLLAGVIPFMTMRDEERRPQHLTQHLLRHLSQEGRIESLLTAGSSFPNVIEQIYKTKLEQFPNKIFIPLGQRLTIKVDRLGNIFQAGMADLLNNFMLTSSLRDVIPFSLEAENLDVDTCLNFDGLDCVTYADEVLLLALLAQEPKILRGLRLAFGTDFKLHQVLKAIWRFKSLRALDLSGSDRIDLSGSTRTGYELRQSGVDLFSRFTRLSRLDLGRTDLQGHLGTLLDALETPLQFVCLSGCAVHESDLVYLSDCKHSTSLKEVHLNELTTNSPEPILRCLERLCGSGLVVAAIQNNSIQDQHIQGLCRAVARSTTLKVLDTLFNCLTDEGLLEIARSTSACVSFKVLSLNLLAMWDAPQDIVVSKRKLLQSKVQDVMNRNNRQDITVVVMAIGAEPNSDSDSD